MASANFVMSTTDLSARAEFLIGIVLRLTVLCVLWSADAAAQNPAAERINRTQRLVASSLDPILPDVPLAEWLQQVMGPSAQYEWSSGACAEQRDRENPMVPLCGIVAATQSEFAVTVAVRLGDYLQPSKTDRWATARLDEAFISHRRTLLVLDRLGDLPRLLALPPQQWPAPDVELESVRCLPANPNLDETVNCAMTLANKGDAASFARVFMDVRPHRSRGGDAAVKLYPRSWRTVRWSFPWMDMDGASITIGAELAESTPYHRVNERGEARLTHGEDLDEANYLLGWEDDAHALQTIVAARFAVAATPRVIDVPVDRSVGRLLISVESVPGVTVIVARPGGARVTRLDSDVTYSDLKTMDLHRQVPANLRLYTMTNPQPGIWQVQLSGSSDAVLVRAAGSSPIDFDDLDFVRLQESVHGGYFQLDGMPLAGVPATARVRLSGGPVEAAFRLVDETGATLQNVRFQKGLPHASEDDFIGTFEPPAVPFRIVMNAVDASGAPIQRQHPATFRAQPVALFFNYGNSDVIAPGTSRRFAFAVSNVGTETETFAFKITAGRGEVLDVSPAVVTIQPGTSVASSFLLVAPTNARPLDTIELRLTATSTADPTVKNRASASLELGRDDDRDNDYVLDGSDNCPDAPNADQIDTNRNGIGDACEPSAGGALSIRGLSPESGPPGTVVKISGTGFSTTAQNIVMFNELPVPAVATTGTELVVTIPPDVAVGPVRLLVGTDNDSVMAPKPFIVRRPPNSSPVR
jgi:hypothetical protein